MVAFLFQTRNIRKWVRVGSFLFPKAVQKSRYIGSTQHIWFEPK